jgi:hypothetical protein
MSSRHLLRRLLYSPENHASIIRGSKLRPRQKHIVSDMIWWVLMRITAEIRYNWCSSTEMLRWKLFHFVPTSLALCYHRVLPASFYCSCDSSPPSITYYPVFYAQVILRATFVSRRGAIIDSYIAALKREAHSVSMRSFYSTGWRRLSQDRIY